MYNIEEINIIRGIYEFITQNTKNNIPSSFKAIADRFNLKIDDAKHFVHLLHYKYNFPIFLEIGTIKDEKTNKTLCRFCKKEHGTFRVMKTEIKSEGTNLRGVIVCDKCYQNIFKNEKEIKNNL